MYRTITDQFGITSALFQLHHLIPWFQTPLAPSRLQTRAVNLDTPGDGVMLQYKIQLFYLVKHLELRCPGKPRERLSDIIKKEDKTALGCEVLLTQWCKGE